MSYAPMPNPGDSEHGVGDAVVVEVPPTGHPKMIKPLKWIAFIVNFCSIVIFVSGVVALGLSISAQSLSVKPTNVNASIALHAHDAYWIEGSLHRMRFHSSPTCCLGGTSLWGGVVLIVTGAFGLATVWYPRNKCCRITFLVLAIISSVLSGVICIMHGLWAGVIDIDRSSQYHRFDRLFGWGNWWIVGGWRIGWVIALNAIICLLAFANMVCLIVGASLWCCNWCSCCGGLDSSKRSQTVSYTMGYPEPQSYGNNPAHMPPRPVHQGGPPPYLPGNVNDNPYYKQ